MNKHTESKAEVEKKFGLTPGTLDETQWPAAPTEPNAEPRVILRRSACRTHTPGPWRVYGGCVVCDSRINDGSTGHDDVNYYGGGHLICESVYHEADRNLIAAAPDMLVALKRSFIELFALNPTVPPSLRQFP